MVLTLGSLFSGVEGFGLGFEQAGFRVAWQVENDRDAVSVLERHYPTVRRYGDVREVDPAQLEPVDVVTFGSPCQDFSVAGRRAGLAGERSGLYGDAIRIITGLRPKPAVCVWENVPGALSSAWGRDFGAALDALADAGALDIAWRVLDAQWFGVAQRRRRVFVVADLRAERAAQVLFEPEGSARDLAACGEAGQGLAGDVEDGAGVVGVAGPLAANETDMLIPEVSGPLTAAMETCRHNGQDDHNNLLVATTVQASAGHHGHSSPRGDGNDNLVVSAIAQNQRGEVREMDVANALGQTGGIPGQGYPAIAFNWQAGGGGNDESFRGKSRQYIERAGDYAGSLTATRHDAVALGFYPTGGTHGVSAVEDGVPSLKVGKRADFGGTAPAVPLHLTQDPSNGEDVDGVDVPALEGSPALSGNADVGVADVGMTVRRLTPRECERLQGWPDDWTRWRADGVEIPDGPRYRMIGNGVVAPVARWLAQRLAAALEGGAV